ncbi:MAG: hypothetical protein KBD65_03880 [Candidatus Moranbacteria bacterium]|jgi:hypothetical protein|nr:hypothetical protein [Candidatus Moranbacteria bacterium]
MLKARLYKVLPGKVEEWKAWCNEIQTIFSEEALRTIKEEGNIFEGCLCFEISGECYAVGFALGDFLPVDENNELNRKHNEKKRACLGEAMPLDVLYFLSKN